MALARESTPTGYLATNNHVRFDLVSDIFSIICWINLDSSQLEITMHKRC